MMPNDRTMYLLKRMGEGRLSVLLASELKRGLEERLVKVKGEENVELEHELRLVSLIRMLEDYLLGKIDLWYRYRPL